MDGRLYVTTIGLNFVTVLMINVQFFFPPSQGSAGDGGGVGGVSPNNRLYSQNYPSIYSGGGEREQGAVEMERDRQPGGGDLEEEDEEEEEEESEEEGRRRRGVESGGEGGGGSSFADRK